MYLQVTTINGAVLRRGDLPVPGGVAHVVDRVLAPITNDRDIVGALRSDPQQRFTTFLKALRLTKLDQELSDYSSADLIKKKFFIGQRVKMFLLFKLALGPCSPPSTTPS